MRARRSWLACLLLCVLWFCATAGLRPLALPDEGRYVGVALEMLRTGQWAVPTLDGMPFFHKPPLFYWLSAASMQVLGVHEFAARLPSAFAAALAATALFAFVRRQLGARPAWGTVLVVAAMPLSYGAAQYANTDMLVAACITGAVLAGAQASLARDAGQHWRGLLALAFAIAAAGVLAKGLIGAVLPALVLLAWGGIRQRFMRVASELAWLPGWLIFLAIAAPWFLAMQSRYPGFAHYFFVVQHFDRFASGGFNNVQPFWFYLAALVLLTLPWSPWLALMFKRTYWQAHRQDRSLLEVRTLMLAWLGAVTLFFSIPASKPVGYILPALPPLAFLCGDAMRHAIRSRSRASPWLPQACLVLAAGGCVGLLVSVNFGPADSTRLLARQMHAARQLDEPVFFLGQNYYDLPFYAGLASTPVLVDSWLPDAVSRDGWRRELNDAAGFMLAGVESGDTGAAPRIPLMHSEALHAALCAQAGSWLIGRTMPGPEFAFLAKLAPVAIEGRNALWHVDSAWRASACPAGQAG